MINPLIDKITVVLKMKKNFPTLLFLILLTSIIFLPLTNSYGHPAINPIQTSSIRIEDESFSSKTTVEDPIIITGQLVKTTKSELNSSIDILVTYEGGYDPVTNFFHNLFYGDKKAFSHNSNWYFNKEINPPEITFAEDEVIINYKITLYPLKAGTFHIHTLLPEALTYGPGGQITIEGENVITGGEFTGLYLPIILLLSIIIISGILSAYFIKRKKIRSKKPQQF